MDRLLRNILENIRHISNGREDIIPNLFSWSVSKESYGLRLHISYQEKREGLYSALTQLHVVTKKVSKTNTLSMWKLLFGYKPTTTTHYEMRLNIYRANSDRKYEFNSNDTPITRDIFYALNNHIEDQEDTDLRDTINISKPDVNLVTDGNIEGHRFE
jgi:hypothetical protein